MKIGINKILVIFVALVSLSFLLGKEFIESDYFSKIVSSRVNDLLLKNANLRFEYSGLQVSVWPFVTILKNLQLSYGDAEAVKLAFDELQIGFNLVDLFSREISINHVKLSKGVILLTNFKPSNGGGQENNNYYLQIRQLLDQLPFSIQQVSLENFVIFYQDFKITFDKFFLEDKRNDIHYFVNLGLENKNLPDIRIDQFQMEGFFSEKMLKVFKASIDEKESNLSLSGEYQINEKKLNFLANFSSDGNSIHRYLKGVKLPFNFQSEKIAGSLKIGGTTGRPTLDYQLTFDQLTTEWLRLDRAQVQGKFQGKTLSIEMFQGSIGKGVIELRKPWSIIDDTGILPDKKVSIQLTRVNTQDALYYLKDNLAILKGNITGNLDLGWDKNGIRFSIGKDCQLTEFLLANNVNSPILKNELIIFNNSVIDANFNGGVDFKIDLQVGNGVIHAIGSIKNGFVNFESTKSNINLLQLGPIGGQLLTGFGDFEFKIRGPLDNVVLHFNYNLEDFSIVGFKLKNLRGITVLALKDNLLKIEDQVADFQGMFAAINGKVDFAKKNLQIFVAIKDADWAGMHYLLSKQLDGMNVPDAKNFQFTAEGTLEIVMNDFQRLNIDSRINFKDLKLYGEHFESAKVVFQVNDDKLNIQEFNLAKNKGNFSGFLIYNFITKNFNYSVFSSDILLNDFELYKILNFGMSSELYFESFGESSAAGVNTKTIVRLDESFVVGKEVEDSMLILQQRDNDIEVTGALFGDQIIAEAKINSGSDETNNVDLNVTFNINKFNELLSILNPHFNSLVYHGNFIGKLHSKFSFPNWDNADLFFDVDQLEIYSDKGLLLSQRPGSGIKVLKGAIDHWDLHWSGDDNSIISKGKGNLHKLIKIDSNFNLNTEMLVTVFPTIFERSSGYLNGHLLFLGNRERNDLFINAQGTRFNMKLANVPGQFEDLQFQSSLAGGNQLLIQNLHAKYEGGHAGISGKIMFTLPFPTADLKINIANCNLRPIAKTNFIINGDLALQGSSLPYLLSGKVNVLLGETSAEFDDFSKNVVASNANPYIPKIASLEKENLHIFENRLDINFLRPVRIKNSLVDLLMNGEFVVEGFPSLPEVKGQMLAVPELSKLKLNGNEFILTEASAKIEKTDFGQKIILRIDGKAKIGDHIVQLTASGDARDLKISFASEPYLPQEDVLSLLTLGVTREMSKNIKDEDRRALTSIGLGNLLVEQLKLSEGLKKMGFQLSIRPEFEQQDSSYLEGRTSPENISKVRSATKISLQQTFGPNDRFNFGLSSTVGGSMQQKKEFNINYFLKRNLTLGTIYEVKEKTEKGVQSPSSFGMDLRIKVDF